MAYLVAVLAATALASFELWRRLSWRFVPPRSALGWGCLRAVLEAVSAIAVLAAAQAASVPTAEKWFGGLIAVGLGSAAARSSFADPQRDDAQLGFGLERLFAPVRSAIEQRLDKINSQGASRWINDEILPALNESNHDLEDMGRRLRVFISSHQTESDGWKTEQVEWVRQVEADTGQPVQDRRELLLQRALELDAYDVIDDMRRAADEG